MSKNTNNNHGFVSYQQQKKELLDLTEALLGIEKTMTLLDDVCRRKYGEFGPKWEADPACKARDELGSSWSTLKALTVQLSLKGYIK